MASLPNTFPQYWRVMGLSVAVGYAGLGSFSMIAPKTVSTLLGLKSDNPQADRVATDSMALLGARDLSIAAALFAFYHQNKPHSMGTVILSSMILCAVDVVWVTMLRQDIVGLLLGVGAASWAYIGYNLVNL